LGRIVFIGKNSSIWHQLSQDSKRIDGIGPALGHRDISDFDFAADDRVWVFSYSRNNAENTGLFEQLKARGAQHVFYVSTASSNVMQITSRFSYPRVKSEAAEAAHRILGARVILLGYVVEHLQEAPSGQAAVVTLDELATAMKSMTLPDPSSEGPVRLFTLRDTAFGSKTEALAYRTYFGLASALGRHVYLLRPVDLILRAFGYRWYGYFGISNRLWSTTISS